ncbi:MAG: hypothetical protein V1743_07350 [Nanoarchaeota archaeon]
MNGTATRKVEGGKLVRIDVSFGKSIQEVRITGDFFLHPEDTILELERTLSHAALPLQKELLEKDIQETIAKHHAVLIGLSAADLVSVLEEALRCTA